MVAITTRSHSPDLTGLAVARAAQAAVTPDTVILFGSRARGDHRGNSDVDLLIIHKQGTTAPVSTARRAAREYFKENPPRLNVDIVPMERQRFDYCRRAKNHVAGQAMRDGVVMSSERLDFTYNYDDDYPESWPDVKERLVAAHRNIRAFEFNLRGLPDDQETYGFHAQQAVENSVKAWLSAAELEYRKVHDLEEISSLIFNDEREASTLAAQQLRMLIDYTTFERPDHSSEHENWLTRYAVDYRYSGTAFRMDDQNRERFHREITLAVHTFINRAHELTGTGAPDLQNSV